MNKPHQNKQFFTQSHIFWKYVHTSIWTEHWCTPSFKKKKKTKQLSWLPLIANGSFTWSQWVNTSFAHCYSREEQLKLVTLGNYWVFFFYFYIFFGKFFQVSFFLSFLKILICNGRIKFTKFFHHLVHSNNNILSLSPFKWCRNYIILRLHALSSTLGI